MIGITRFEYSFTEFISDFRLICLLSQNMFLVNIWGKTVHVKTKLHVVNTVYGSSSSGSRSQILISLLLINDVRKIKSISLTRIKITLKHAS